MNMKRKAALISIPIAPFRLPQQLPPAFRHSLVKRNTVSGHGVGPIPIRVTTLGRFNCFPVPATGLGGGLQAQTTARTGVQLQDIYAVVPDWRSSALLKPGVELSPYS